MNLGRVTQLPKLKVRVTESGRISRLRPWRVVKSEIKKLEAILGIPKTTSASVRTYIEAQKRITGEFREKIFRNPGAAKAVSDLQSLRLDGGEILELVARLAVEIQSHWHPSKPLLHLPGAVTFPSAEGARRAKALSKKVRSCAREIREFQSRNLQAEFVLHLYNWKTESERKRLSITARTLPGALESYAIYLDTYAALLRPPRGRRSRPALEEMTRSLVRAVLKTLDDALGSTYGALEPLAVLIGAAYDVAGAPRRISPKTLRRLLDENRT